jgi:hypothetical protein
MADYVVYHVEGTTSERASSTAPSSSTAPGSSTAASSGGVFGEDESASTDGGDVHVVVGAAHQPGVRYYLERHRDGDRSAGSFDVVLG